MTDLTINKRFNEISNRINEITQQLDNYTVQKHQDNRKVIDVNANGIDDLAEVTDIGLTALDELTDYIASLEERIAALEGKEE
jgi:methyl-accepting chemotaxis protein